MPAKNLLRTSVEGSYVHIYNRGIENKTIFNDREDYDTFLSYLKEYLTPPANPESLKRSFTVKGREFKGTPHQAKNYFGKVDLIAYSLKPDHFHLLLQQKEAGSLASLLRSLSTRYSIFFNKKYQHAGGVFNGPYKSIEIKDKPQMILLAWYFHQGRGYSSFEEHMGTRKTSWVSHMSGLEKYKPSDEEKVLLEKISLENISNHLEVKPNVVPEPIKAQNASPPPSQGQKRQWRIPEYIMAAGIFFILTTLGIRNINASSAVLGDKTIATPIPTASPSATPTLTPTPAPKKTLVVQITDGSQTINIRKDPTIMGDVVGQAKNGQTLEYISLNAGWYKVFIQDGTGYISSKYVKVIESSN